MISSHRLTRQADIAFCLFIAVSGQSAIGPLPDKQRDLLPTTAFTVVQKS